MARSTSRPMDSCRRPYFFKVFFPQLSSQHLSIPSAFQEHIKGEAPGTASLRGPSGMIWYVGLVKDSSGLCFRGGWEEFVADHSMQLGDFLVFRYDGNSHFTVLLFDATACEKKLAFFARPCQEEIIDLEEGEVGASLGEEDSKAFIASPNGSFEVAQKRKRGRVDCFALEGSPRKKHSPSGKITAKQSRALSGCGSIKKSKPIPRRGHALNDRHSPRSLREKHSPSNKFTARQSHVCSGRASIKRSESSPRCRHARNSPHSGVLATPRKSAAMAKQRGKTPSSSSSNEDRKAALRVKRGMGDKLSLRRTLNKKSNCSAESKYQSKRVAKTSLLTGTLKRRYTRKKPIEFVKSSTTKRSNNKVPSDCLPLIESIQVCRPGEAIVGELRVGSLISQRRPVTEEEVDKALEMAKSFKSKNPFTTIVMRESYVYASFFLHIPRQFTDEHLPKDTRKMTLWDSNGDPWPVIYSIYSNCGRFGGGWGKFTYTHNLEQHDVCVFELIGKNQMRVHIFRVVEELTPLIRVVKGRRQIIS